MKSMLMKFTLLIKVKHYRILKNKLSISCDNKTDNLHR